MNQDDFESQLEKTNRQVEATSLQIAKTNRQAEETNKRLEILVETQTEFIQVVTRHIEAQDEINKSIRNTVRDLSVTSRKVATGKRN